jgi:hypothetical protein
VGMAVAKVLVRRGGCYVVPRNLDKQNRQSAAKTIKRTPRARATWDAGRTR